MKRKYETAMLQDWFEIQQFCELLQRERVNSYLEIGSKFGGSLWHVAQYLPKHARIVSVDLPQGDKSFKESRPHLEECVAQLKERGRDSHLIIGDSTDPEVVARATVLGPFDACFIDGGHAASTVWKDWRNYGPLARIVAFHDIAWQPRDPPSKKVPLDVPKVWHEIKGGFRHIEIKAQPRDCGIGVLWRS